LWNGFSKISNRYSVGQYLSNLELYPTLNSKKGNNAVGKRKAWARELVYSSDHRSCRFTKRFSECFSSFGSPSNTSEDAADETAKAALHSFFAHHIFLGIGHISSEEWIASLGTRQH
jgi:hypothetical protein